MAPRSTWIFAMASAAGAVLLAADARVVEAADEPPGVTPAAAPSALSPRATGARYGQAAGVALVCYGMRTTGAGEALKARFSGADLEAFNDEAEKVLAAWRVLQGCHKAGGPNECRLTHVWSCRDALREIGPEGTALPGLVESKGQ